MGKFKCLMLIMKLKWLFEVVNFLVHFLFLPPFDWNPLNKHIYYTTIPCLRSIEASWSSCNALHWPEDWFDLISGALNVVPDRTTNEDLKKNPALLLSSSMQIHMNYLWIRKVGFSFVILKMHVHTHSMLKVNSRKLALGCYADSFFRTAVLMRGLGW